ncbi:MAG: sugar phosphate isomerase/epimerase [Chitinophaga sp.]|uniref:sugar phosphate isomerase/epimerase n=1 Tax=Chitinophaga sp. TaxID=1869181 RepID=UPI001B268D88|nr:sugar phosphate isomerase/epimerase [Chitinophaga sp.]MBO9732411.1 sugar phosphate isomerase/epimerase [Chitinophaga sp.]
MKRIQFYCPRWGSETLSISSFCQKAKEEGYDGIEYGVPVTAATAELDEAWNVAEKLDMKIIIQHYDTVESDFSRHYDRYCEWIAKIEPYPAVKVNSQTGKDYYSFEQNCKLIAAAAASNKPVLHETHRNKFTFAAHITRTYLEQLPELRITLDASHWVCVAESYLEDQEAVMQLATERTDHLHARVGYPEGPQVPDPRIKEWEYALNRHLHWWDKVVDRKKQENEILTIAPEFGPYPYMVHDPVTGRPVADQWMVNVYMMNFLKERYY